MSEDAPSRGWTIEALKEHLATLLDGVEERLLTVIEVNDRRYEQRFIDSQTAVSAALTAATARSDTAVATSKEAVQKAEAAAEKRFEGVNEFRETLADQQRNLMPRLESEQRMKTLEERIAKAETALISSVGAKAGGQQLWGWIVGALGMASLLYNVFTK